MDKQARHPIAIGALLVTAWLSAAAALANGPEPEPIESRTSELPSLPLHFDDGLLSLHANQRPYQEVLGAIQKVTGIRFHYSIPMSEVVTVSFKDVPVQEALKRLLGREAQFMFRFPEGSITASRAGVPEEVWILGKVSGPIPEASGPADEPQPGTEPATSEQPDIESLIETTKAEDPIQRLGAVSALAASGNNADQETVHAALDTALTDENAVVRAQAVQALLKRGGPEARGYLEQALRDPDPGVRIMALESVDPAKHGVDLVKQALSDSEPAVRAMAEAMLHPETQ